jgi:excisionase family DNA binding protein
MGNLAEASRTTRRAESARLRVEIGARGHDRPERAHLDAAIRGIRQAAEAQATQVIEAAERRASEIVVEAEARISTLEAEWAIAAVAGNPPVLLTTKGAAAVLGMSESTVKVLLREGKLPSFMFGGRRYLTRVGIEEFATNLGERQPALIPAHVRPGPRGIAVGE